MRIPLHLGCFLVGIGVTLAQAGESTKVVLATNALTIVAGESVVVECHAVGSAGEKLPLVHGPWTHSGSEGSDLALEFSINWGNGTHIVLSEQATLFTSGSTAAFRVMTAKADGRTPCLVVIHDKKATLYINDHWLTAVPQEYAVVVRYRSQHRAHPARPEEDRVWSEAASLAVRVSKKDANKVPEDTARNLADPQH